MNKEIIKYKNIASVSAILMLLLAIPEGIWPYGYYVLLRWLVAGVAAFVIWIASNLEKQGWMWLMVIIVILFNPIMPIHLDKEIWVVTDFIVAIIFLVSIFKIKLKE